MIRSLAIVVGFLVALAPRPSAGCEVALVMMIDASPSFSREEWNGTVQAHIDALRSDRVIRVAQNGNMKVAVAAFTAFPTTIVPLTDVRGRDDIEAIVSVLQVHTTSLHDQFGSGTGTGEAVLHGVRLLEGEEDCARHVIDVATDGQSNIGRNPQMARDLADARGIQVNAVALQTTGFGVVNDDPAGWARENVQTAGGETPRGFVRPGFVIEAQGWESWSRAIGIKVVMEVADAR